MIYVYNTRKHSKFYIFPPFNFETCISNRRKARYYALHFTNDYGLHSAITIEKDNYKAIYIGDTLFTYEDIDKNPDVIMPLIEQENIKDTIEALP